MISVLPRHIPLRGVSHCCHGCLQYTAIIISPDTHTRSGRLHSSHPPRSSPARLPAALHLALRSGVLGRCSPHHHPHSHPGETREKRPQEPPSTHITRGTPGFLPGSPPGDKPGFVSSLGFSQGCGKCGFLVFSRMALWGVVRTSLVLSLEGACRLWQHLNAWDPTLWDRTMSYGIRKLE